MGMANICEKCTHRNVCRYQEPCEECNQFAEEVVRCKECRWGKPYNRNDGEIGYYCGFCGHSFKYGTAWERVYEPIKEAEDFCSYGERREGE